MRTTILTKPDAEPWSALRDAGCDGLEVIAVPTGLKVIEFDEAEHMVVAQLLFDRQTEGNIMIVSFDDTTVLEDRGVHFCVIADVWTAEGLSAQQADCGTSISGI